MRFPSCTCCRHYPGAASERHCFAHYPAVSAFPERVIGSACASSFSRLAQRLEFTRVAACTLAPSPIRDAHSEGFSHFVTSIAAPVAPAGAVAGWDLHPLESAALSRRTLSKHGKALCGVARKYTGSALQYYELSDRCFAASSRHRHAFIDRALHSPKGWTRRSSTASTAHTCRRCQLFDHASVAAEMSERALCWRAVPLGCVRYASLRSVISSGNYATRDKGYVLGVDCNHWFASRANRNGGYRYCRGERLEAATIRLRRLSAVPIRLTTIP